jgi:hypothetical protein
MSISPNHQMDTSDPERGRSKDVIPLHGRRASERLSAGSGDPRNGESALAREFARRALTPIITDLRDKHGVLDARRIAPALGLTTAQLASCLELPEALLTQSPPSPDLEARLEPFMMVIGVVRDVYGGDSARVRVWLSTPRPELGGKTPNESLCEPAGIQHVIQFVVSAWLGNAD